VLIAVTVSIFTYKFMSSKSPESKGKEQVFLDNKVQADPESIAASLLNLAESYERKQNFLQAETHYKRLLSHQLVEAHDPVRLIILRRYAALLGKLKREQEARRFLEEAESISIRRKIDRHPPRAHVS
jgi:tetratricopeptide (TPR) repeat protein